MKLFLNKMRQLKFLFTVAFVFIFALCKIQAQMPPTVVVHKDPRIDLLIKKQGDINTAVKKATTRTARGFRLMVINTNKRDEAIAARTKIYTYFPEIKSYLSYQTPYFKLKAGNFKTRAEAEEYRKNMATLFPKGVFIVNDIIEIKPEKEEETQ